MEGKLTVSPKKTLQVTHAAKKGPVTKPVPENALSSELKNKSIEDLDGMLVEVELNKDSTIASVCQKGRSWQDPSAATTDFFNPYNFIPITHRLASGPLADAEPVSHGCQPTKHWAGVIAIRLKVVTPLLMLDVALATGDDHKVFSLKKDKKGLPSIPPTSFKGVLRSAYEAITDSRMSVFVKHDRPLAFRKEAKATAIPVRVEKRAGELFFRRLGNSQSFARLRRYDTNSKASDRGESVVATRYQDGSLPQHRDRVAVKVEQDRGRIPGIVSSIRKLGEGEQVPNGWHEGWVHVTGANIKNKKYERVFRSTGNDSLIRITEKEQRLWTDLVSNYRMIHEKELEGRRSEGQSPADYLGDDPGDTAWSQHIWKKDAIDLAEGVLCYVHLDANNNVLAVMPVSISRQLFAKSPSSLLPESVRPARDRTELSPADRVFGWVNQKGNGAYKGHLRIEPFNCETKDPIERLNTELPLAILGEPKPQQSRFYLGIKDGGKPIPNGTAKDDAGFSVGKQLRGRKVYPHHKGLSQKYWSSPYSSSAEVDGRYREYLRGAGTKDRKNRSVKEWVKVGTEFSTCIHVDNLSDVEVGALMWLLHLPADCFLRMGGGKPLGFGSVRVEIDWTRSDLRSGDDWKQYYSSLNTENRPFNDTVKETVQKYKDAIEMSYGTSFENVSFIKAFIAAGKGLGDKPVHYPRTTRQPDSKGESYKWFVENEKPQCGKIALPLLQDGCGLPFSTNQEKK